MASHLSMEERKRISELRDAGYSRGQIAGALARAKSTISREIERNRLGCLYCPVVATQKALERRRQRKLVRKMDRPEIADPVRCRLKEYHSPDEIAGWMKLTISNPRNRISATTIYRWIQAQPRGTWNRYLRRYGKRRRGRKPSGMPGAAQIDGRPAEAEERAVCGHWEGDTVWGGNRPSGLVTLATRHLRKHQRPPPPVLPQRHFPRKHFSATRRACSTTTQPPTAEIPWVSHSQRSLHYPKYGCN